MEGIEGVATALDPAMRWQWIPYLTLDGLVWVMYDKQYLQVSYLEKGIPLVGIGYYGDHSHRGWIKAMSDAIFTAQPSNDPWVMGLYLGSYSNPRLLTSLV
jgi:hypothetical protein